MKYLLLLLLLSSSYSLALPLSEDKAERLQEIIRLFKNDSNKEAIEKLKLHEYNLLEAIKTSKDAKAYLLLGRAYFYAELDSKAIKALNTALQYNSSLSDAHYFIGLINNYSNNLDDAEKSFRSAIELDNNNDKFFVELGRILDSKSDSKSALIEYRNALKINPMNSSANFYSANIYMSMGNDKKAEKHYLAAVEINPGNININYNLGQLYQNTGQHHLAIDYLSKVVELDAYEWRAIAKIVQENQALGKIAERDIAVDRIYALWRTGEVSDLLEQGFYIREQSHTEMGKMYVLEYFELKGERARKFVFTLEDPVTGDNKFDVSLGSYDGTTQISRELGEIGPDERIYHLDGYAPNGSHYTYAFYNSEPDYDVIQKVVLEILLGKHRPLSSTTPSNAGSANTANQ